MSSTSLLVGPPALRYEPPSTAVEIPVSGDDPITNLTDKTSNLDLSKLPLRGLTENNSATFISSGNPCLDFFFHVVPDTSADDLIGRLELAWAHNPLTALKLICNLRGVRGTD